VEGLKVLEHLFQGRSLRQDGCPERTGDKTLEPQIHL